MDELQQALAELWQRALVEDGVADDVTTQLTRPSASAVAARVNARQAGVFAGEALFRTAATVQAHGVRARLLVRDGQDFDRGDTLAVLSGPAAVLLGIERTLLNFLGRLCGVATLTRHFVRAVEGTTAKICDTRKTLPGWRLADKYAVRCGGGLNHRMGLHDAVLVKDNHMAAFPLGRWAVEAARIVGEAIRRPRPPDFIGFEVDNLDQLEILLGVPGIDLILLDNFTVEQLGEAVRRRDARCPDRRPALEASGGVNLETAGRIARTGVDRIAVGALTHSAPACDLGLDF